MRQRGALKSRMEALFSFELCTCSPSGYVIVLSQEFEKIWQKVANQGRNGGGGVFPERPSSWQRAGRGSSGTARSLQAPFAVQREGLVGEAQECDSLSYSSVVVNVPFYYVLLLRLEFLGTFMLII